MVISPLAASDTEEVVKLARINWAESRFQWLPFDDTKIRANLIRMIEAPATSNCAIVVRNHAGKLVGYLAGSIEEYFFCRARIASSVFLFVDPAERGGQAAVVEDCSHVMPSAVDQISLKCGASQYWT